MTVTTFNLLDEPWLGVRDLKGQTKTVSLRGAFASAHQLVGLAGDLPTQEVALLRLLVAILYRALPAPLSIEDRVDLWERWWTEEALPIAEIDGYLGQYRERFDLLHPHTPFMQVATLSANKTSGLGKLIADMPDGEQYFTTRAARGADSIELAEAARWLVHAQAYDPSGIKSGAHDDPRVKGGKGYPIGIGWTGWCGLLIPQGRTLKETLLLSMALNVDSAGPGRDADRPVWERAPVTGAPEVGHEEPHGTADLLTWQVRRVRLITVGDRVVDALITNGDPIHPRNRQQLEPHCAWRHSPTQEKLHGGQVYMPRAHEPERALWRGLPGLLPLTEVEDDRASSGPAPILAPTVLHWLATLVYEDVLPGHYPVRLRAVGVTYGSNSSTISAVTDDRVRLRAVVLGERRLCDLVRDMVFSAEAAVRVLCRLAVDLAAASGEHETEGHRDRASEDAYAALDRPFRRWLDSVDDVDLDVLARAWQDEVRQILVRIGDDLIKAAGRPAWLGRNVEGFSGSGRHHMDASRAALKFRAALQRALPAATPPQPIASSPKAPATTFDGEEKQ